jgi:hypothetical protein
MSVVQVLLQSSGGRAWRVGSNGSSAERINGCVSVACVVVRSSCCHHLSCLFSVSPCPPKHSSDDIFCFTCFFVWEGQERGKDVRERAGERCR